MVSAASIAFSIFSIVISIGLPIGLFIFLRIKYKISYKAAGIGILVFILFSQVLERIVHWYFLSYNPATALIIKQQPVIYGIYGGLAAGIFEETGRFIAFMLLLKTCRKWEDGISYGLGHGGIESILIGGLSGIGTLSEAVLINTGALDKLISSAKGETLSQLESMKSSLLSTAPALFAVSGLERAMALVIQLALSLLVLYGIKNKKYIFLLYAILIHALIDFPAVIYQSGKLSIWIVEGLVLIEAAIALIFVIRSRKFFTEKDTITAQ